MLCLTVLVWFIPLFLLFTAQTFTWKMQSSPSAHCMLLLTAGYTGMTAADGAAVRQRDKSWWNMRSCHIPSVQTRHGCKGRVCSRQKLYLSYLFLVFYSVWVMLICFCQDSFPHAKRTKGKAQRSSGIQEELRRRCLCLNVLEETMPQIFTRIPRWNWIYLCIYQSSSDTKVLLLHLPHETAVISVVNKTNWVTV